MMLHLLIWLLAAIPAFAILNRVRGGGLFADKLPGRALYWIAPVIGLACLPILPWRIAAVFALGYLIWGLMAWGYTLTRLAGIQEDRKPSWFEGMLEVFGPPPVQTFIRMMFVMPCVIGVAYLLGDWRYLIAGPVFAALTTLIYAVLFKPLGKMDWARAEYGTGVLWALLIGAAALL